MPPKKKEEIPENKFLQIEYSSYRNITFHNRKAPDYIPLPDHWDEYSLGDKSQYVKEELRTYLDELVELDWKIVKFSEREDV